MIILQKIQTFVTTATMIGVWSNLYVNFYKYKKDDTQWDKQRKRS